mmetsp:Transcript_15041/g.37587  ORF Transcript_15041/g.37587 Transcript_15041/m.37587 type:complete len:278 (+) Transcript_15041:904-1737(+)
MEAALPDHRALLVADDATDWSAVERASVGHGAYRLGGGDDLGERGLDGAEAECFDRRAVPLALVQVHQHRARGVAHVGHVASRGAMSAPRKVPDDPAVHSAEQGGALLEALLHRWHIVKQPAQLHAAEIRRDRQAAARAEAIDSPQLGGEHRARRGRAHVVPQDHVAQRRAAPPVPHDSRLTLVGHADADEVGGLRAHLLERAARAGVDGVEDGHRVHLRPAWPRGGGCRLKLDLVAADGGERLVVQDDTATARALVDGGEQAPCARRRAEAASAGA